MLAVIELGWNQFTVWAGETIDVKRKVKEVNATFSMEAMLISDEEGKSTKVGVPTVAGSKVEFKVIEQFKGEKVRVFKKKSKTFLRRRPISQT